MNKYAEDILKKISKDDLINLTNDENRNSDRFDEFEDDNDPVVIRIVSAYTEAETKINPYIANLGLEFPLETVPPLLEAIRRDLSIIELYRRRLFKKMPESIIELEKTIYKTLDMVRRKELKLGIEETAVESHSTSIVNKKKSDRLFTEGLLGKFNKRYDSF